MKFPRLAAAIFRVLVHHVAARRPPDFIVGHDSPDGAYLNRWFLTPWRPWQRTLGERARANPSWLNRTAERLARLLPNLYLHQFLRDDDDRALHDHPSWGASFLLSGSYIEHTIAAGGIHHRRWYKAGTLRFMRTRHAHRIELNGPMHYRPEHDDDGNVVSVIGTRLPERYACWTLFLFGPVVREWGFHCPENGWVHWREFTAAGDPGMTGPGCDA